MASHTKLVDLAAALSVEHGELIALVGGGGKTTSLFALGQQLTGTTVLTTTTKMGADQTNELPVLIDPSDDEIRAALAAESPVLAWKNADDRRAIGVAPETCDRWFELADNVVVEADGSRKRPFKAPVEYEPVIPSQTTLLVACIGASALHQPIDEVCHRPQVVADLLDCGQSDPLTPFGASEILMSEHGSMKGLPSRARFAVVIHRVRPESERAVAELVDHIGWRAPVVTVAQQLLPLT